MLAGSKLGPGWSLPRLVRQRCLTCEFTRCAQTSTQKAVQWKGPRAVAVHDERYLIDRAEKAGIVFTGHTTPPTWIYRTSKIAPKTRTTTAEHHIGGDNAEYRLAGDVSHPHVNRDRRMRSVLRQSLQRYQTAPRDEGLQRLLHVLLAAPTISGAWKAYEGLITKYPYDPLQKPVIPYGHLHRLAGRLASVKPRTRTLYLQLSSVLATLRRTGGRVYIWEWNTLIDCAGKQWRKTSIADYRAALDILNDMKTPPRLPEHPTSG
ncbi:hypothetical protein EDC04DRAFT_579690 [Pisolithus marmoratus]|nr:hypothetical protein EDC04DRAFT_579690 [Pisolithus marmoratus]